MHGYLITHQTTAVWYHILFITNVTELKKSQTLKPIMRKFAKNNSYKVKHFSPSLLPMSRKTVRKRKSSQHTQRRSTAEMTTKNSGTQGSSLNTTQLSHISTTGIMQWTFINKFYWQKLSDKKQIQVSEKINHSDNTRISVQDEPTKTTSVTFHKRM